MNKKSQKNTVNGNSAAQAAELAAQVREKIMQRMDLLCRTSCGGGLTCMSGMNCRGGEKDTPCDVPYHAPLQDYELRERIRERQLLSVFARLKSENMVLVKNLQDEGLKEDLEIALDKALKKMTEAGRPICPRDFLEMISKAIRERVKAFKDSESMLNAAWLYAAVLTDSVLAEALTPEDDPGGHTGNGTGKARKPRTGRKTA